MEETPTYTSGRSTKAFKLKVEYRKTVRVDAVCGLPPIGIVSEFEFQLNRASHRRHSADRTRIAGRRPSPQLVRCANRQPSDVHRVIAALYRTVAAHLKLQNKGAYAMSHKTTTAGSWIAQRGTWIQAHVDASSRCAPVGARPPRRAFRASRHGYRRRR